TSAGRGMMRTSTKSTDWMTRRLHSSRKPSARWSSEMSRPESELLPEKPEARLSIYAWSSDEVAERWRDCLKVGQTAKDVNVRIKESQGQARVAYKLHV